jgi:hypothetical protein
VKSRGDTAQGAPDTGSLSTETVLAVLLVVASGLGALLQGQDANIDLYRYRFYIGYAFVHHRLDRDLVPSALGTFLNPTLDAFHYLGIAYLGPRVFSFLLGSLQGLNAVLVLWMARLLLPKDSSARVLAALAAVLAASGPTARSLLGTTLGDTTVSLPALLALWLLLRGQDDSGAVRVAVLGAVGFLGGAAVGLKLTMATSFVALAAVVLLGVATRAVAFGGALAFMGGSALGYLSLAGYWCWQLWQRFENPIFPYANQIFRSPYFRSSAIRDHRWLATGPLDYLSPPALMALGATTRLQEIPFRDGCLALVAVAALAWVVLRLAGRCPPLRARERTLLVYFAVLYLTWASAFYYWRYGAALEYLAPLVLVVLARAILGRLARPVCLAAAAVLLATTTVGSWGRLDWGERWFYVRLPPQAYEPDSLVLVDSPLSSFLIPYFPEEARFAGLEWTGSQRFEELVAARIASHRGNLFWLVSRGRPAESTSPARFGLEVTDDCGPIRTGEGKWALCRLRRPSGPRT